jgi:hypothetical protein
MCESMLMTAISLFYLIRLCRCESNGFQTVAREGLESVNRSVIISLSLFPVTPTLEHMASVKRFVSLQFLNPKRVGGTPWRGGSARRKAATYKNRINTDKHPCLQWDSNPQSQRSSERRHFIP